MCGLKHETAEIQAEVTRGIAVVGVRSFVRAFVRSFVRSFVGSFVFSFASGPRVTMVVACCTRVKTVLLRHVYIKTNILPRQARDKHRESETQKKPVLSGWLLHIAEHLCRQIPRGGGGGGGGSSSSSSENPAAADADGAPKPARYGNATLFAMPFDTKNAFILPRQARDRSGESSTQKREVIDACFDLQGETLG